MMNKTTKTLTALVSLSLVCNIGMFAMNTSMMNAIQATNNTPLVVESSESHQTTQEALKVIREETKVKHPEDVKIVVEANDNVCGEATPIQATITNTSRNHSNVDGVMFYVAAQHNQSVKPLLDYNEPFVSVNLDLDYGESVIQCYAVPHEVVNDAAYDDSTYYDYRYFPTITKIVYGEQ